MEIIFWIRSSSFSLDLLPNLNNLRLLSVSPRFLPPKVKQKNGTKELNFDLVSECSTARKCSECREALELTTVNCWDWQKRRGRRQVKLRQNYLKHWEYLATIFNIVKINFCSHPRFAPLSLLDSSFLSSTLQLIWYCHY